MTQNISLISISYFLIFIIPMLLIIRALKIPLIKDSIISISRMVIQLLLVGVYLQYIFKWDNPLINILYLLVMITIATCSIGNSVKLKIASFFPILFFSVGLPMILLLCFFTIFIVGRTNPLEAKYMIPLSGMILGNTLNGNIVTLNNFFKTFRYNEDEYLFTLALGANKKEALLPYIRESLSASITPTIASIATMGLVSLPGMMTGQILGGSSPLIAIKYQIAIMLAILSSKFFSSFLSLSLASKYFFNPYHILNKNVFK